MTTPGLRELVASVVRDTVAELADKSSLGAAAPDTSADAARVEVVRIADDADLASFIRKLLRLYDNPKRRLDLRGGRLRFTLDRTAAAAVQRPAPRPVRRVERGAVTERAIIAAAEARESLVLGPAAVLTPLARDKARSLGVHLEKERS